MARQHHQSKNPPCLQDRCREFSAFTGLREPTALRTVARTHVIAWRKHLESRNLTPASIRRKLSALSSLFDYLCERNAVAGNPPTASSGQFPTITKAARRRSAMGKRR